MADQFITELDAITTFANTDLMVVETDPSGTPETNKMTLANWIDNYLRRQNYTITRSVASNNLTVSILDGDGNAASAAKPLYFTINGTPRKLSGALSLTLNAGTNRFNLGSAELATLSHSLFVYVGWRASDASMFMLLSRMPHGNYYADFSATTTSERHGSPTGAAPAATDRVEVIGRVNVILGVSASYNWSVPAGDLIISRPVYETEVSNWNPVWSANGSMTYTSVSTTMAKYQIRGGNLKAFTRSSGTIGGTPNTSVLCTLPFESVFIATAAEQGVGTGDNAMGRAFLAAGTPDLITITRYDSANWTAGTRVAAAEIEYWI